MRRPFVRLLYRALRLVIWKHRDRSRRLDVAEHMIRLKDQEIASLRVQLETYRDTIQSFGWERRAIGAEAKAYAESLRGQQ